MNYDNNPIDKSFMTSMTINNNQPYYIIDISKIDEQVLKWNKYLSNVKLFYAVKCNPDINIIKRLIDLNCSFDCASKNEIKLILDLTLHPKGMGGWCPTNNNDNNFNNVINKLDTSEYSININKDVNNIVFANPIKSYNDIQYAIDNNVYKMTVDCVSELIKIKKIDVLNKVKLFIRINVDDSYSVCQLNKKFGANIYDVHNILKYIVDNDMNLYGISFHVGSGCNSPIAYEKAIENSYNIYNIILSYGLNISVLDIGGGFLANDFNNYVFSDIATTINNSLHKYFSSSNIQFIAEPGRFIAENTSILLTNIIGVKKNNHINVYHIDESTYMGFNCIYNDHNNNFLISVLDNDNKIIMFKNKLVNSNDTLFKSQLNGCTCDSIDILNIDFMLPDLNLDYKLIFHHFGAYTYAAGASFNGMELPNKIYLNY